MVNSYVHFQSAIRTDSDFPGAAAARTRTPTSLGVASPARHGVHGSHADSYGATTLVPYVADVLLRQLVI